MLYSLVNRPFHFFCCAISLHVMFQPSLSSTSDPLRHSVSFFRCRLYGYFGIYKTFLLRYIAMSAYADLLRTHRVLEGVHHFRELPTVRTTHSHAYHVAQRHTSVSRAVLSILTERTTTERLLQYIEEKAKARASPKGAKRCCICLKKEKTYVAVPCGHYRYCSVCIDKISCCAICRTRIVHKVRVFE